MKKNQLPSIQQNDSSNQPISVGDMIDKVLVVKEDDMLKVLKEKCNILSQAVDQLQKQLTLKEEEILVLRSQLQSPGLLSVTAPTDEELIIEAQLRIIKQSGALQRPLSLDEMKMFDLLVKNKKIVKQPEAPIDVPNQLKDKSPTELLKLAQVKRDK